MGVKEYLWPVSSPSIPARGEAARPRADVMDGKLPCGDRRRRPGRRVQDNDYLVKLPHGTSGGT